MGQHMCGWHRFERVLGRTLRIPLLTAGQGEDVSDRFGEDGFGVCVLTGVVVGGFLGASKQTGGPLSRVARTGLKEARRKPAASHR